MTGSDRIVARFLHQEYFEYDPTHKLWLVANHYPVIQGTDDAIWRRVLLVPFEKQIPQEKRQPLGKLLARARKEHSAILNWLVDGWQMYREAGLQIPEKVRLATNQYRSESDQVQQFLDECCTQAGQVSSQELYEAFKTWSGKAGVGLRAFQERLKRDGFTLQAGAYKKRYWQGISLVGGTSGTSGS